MMSIIQDKLGNEFLRNGSMDPNFAPSMIMFSHLPPVTSFTRLTSQPVVTDLPQEMVLKKERDSPEHGGGFLHSMGIKQEKFNELDYHIPLYGTGPGTGGGKSSDMLDISLGSHPQNILLHDVNINSVSTCKQRMAWELYFCSCVCVLINYFCMINLALHIPSILRVLRNILLFAFDMSLHASFGLAVLLLF